MGLPKEELRISTLVPAFFRCPISLEVMRDPVSLCTGVTYERANIEKWMDAGNNVCPATREALKSSELIPNHTLRRLIQEWCLSKGFDRIPTPKSPANPSKIRRMAQEICNMDDAMAGLEALKTLNNMAKTSSRNRKCMQAAGILKVLAQLIVSRDPCYHDREMVREAVGVITCFESLDEATRQILRGPRTLSFLESLLSDHEKEARMNTAVLVEILSRDISFAREIGSREAIVEALISLLREEEAEEASINALFNFCAVARNRVKIAVCGHSIDALTTIVMNGKEKRIKERALGVMEALSTVAEGRAAIEDSTLAIGGVVKSLLRVSPMADEYSVGIMWRLCLKSCEDDVLNESLLAGALNKLLMFVQIDSTSPATKAKANQLLKLLSPLRHSHYNHAS